MNFGQVLITKETSLVTQLLINDFPAFAVSCTQQLQGFYNECLDDSHSFISRRYFDECEAIEDSLNAEHSAVLEQESSRFVQEKAILLRQAPESYQEQLARRLHEVSKLRVEAELMRRFPGQYCGCIHLKVDYETYTRRWLEVFFRTYRCEDKEQERERIVSHSDYALLVNAAVCCEKNENEKSPYDAYTMCALRSLKEATGALTSKSVLKDQEIKMLLVASFSEAYIASIRLYNGSVQEIKRFFTKKGSSSNHKRIDSGRYSDNNVTQSKIQLDQQQKTFLAIFSVFDAVAKLPREAAENFSVDPIEVKTLKPEALGKLQKMVGKFFVEVNALYEPLKLLCSLPRNANQEKFGTYIETFERILSVFEKIILFNKRA